MCGSIGAAAAGPILGAIIENLGWNALFMTVVIAFAVAGFSWLVVNCTRRLVIIEESEEETGTGKNL